MSTTIYKSNIIRSYNNIAHERDKYKNDTWEVKERIKFIEFLKNNGMKKVLDAGAGNGWDSKFFKENELEVISIDISAEMVNTCKEKGLEAYVMDFYKIEFENETFDAIWSLNSMLHIPKEDFVNILNEFKRLLRPNGLMYIGIWGGFDREGLLVEDKQTPKRFFNAYTDDEIKKVVSQTFDIVEYNNIDVNRKNVYLQTMILKLNSMFL